MRGQAAVEYLLIFSAVLVIFATVTFGQMITPTQEAGRDTLHLSQARFAADAISGAINSVYSNEKGAVKSVSFPMDSNWDLQLTENKLTISLKTSNGTQNVQSNLKYGFNGSLQNLSAGTYTAIVEWSSDNNSLTPDNYKITINIKPVGG